MKKPLKNRPSGKQRRADKTQVLADTAIKIKSIEDQSESDKVNKIKKLAEQRDLIKATLNDRQVAFCTEYLKDRNGTKAAIRAGYSPTTASSQQTEILGIPEIQAFLAVSQRILDLDTGITQEWIVEEFKKLAQITAKDLYAADGSLIPPHELPEHVAAAVSEVRQKLLRTSEDGKTQVFEFIYKLHSKVAALDALGKFKGIYEKDNRQKEPAGGGVVIYMPDNGRDNPNKTPNPKK